MSNAQTLTPTLTPRLVVDDGPGAIAFYVEAFGARELERLVLPSGQLVHAALQIGSAVFTLTEADGDANRSPQGLGGSSIIMGLSVDDPDGLAERAVACGAEVIFAIEDRDYGRREGRICDPQGHLWIVGRPL